MKGIAIWLTWLPIRLIVAADQSLHVVGVVPQRRTRGSSALARRLPSGPIGRTAPAWRLGPGSSTLERRPPRRPDTHARAAARLGHAAALELAHRWSVPKMATVADHGARPGGQSDVGFEPSPPAFGRAPVGQPALRPGLGAGADPRQAPPGRRDVVRGRVPDHPRRADARRQRPPEPGHVRDHVDGARGGPAHEPSACPRT
jgi:hypothetical protein